MGVESENRPDRASDRTCATQALWWHRNIYIFYLTEELVRQGQLVIRGLRVGDSRFDVMLRRHDRDVSVNVLERLGKGRVVTTL